MRFRHASFAVACGALLASLPSAAHHSHGNYNMTEWVPFEGTVKELHLINPHSWLYVEVESNEGPPVVWALEATTPAGLIRNGVQPNDVQPDDAIRVRCHRLKDGSNGCLLGFVTPLHGDTARGHGIEREWD